MLKTMDRQLDRLTHLVEDLLNVTNLMTGQHPLCEEPVSVDELVQMTVEECHCPTTRGRGHTGPMPQEACQPGMGHSLMGQLP